MATELPAVETGSSELEELADLVPGLALREAVPLLARLANDPAFLDAYVLPHLDEARGTEDWYVAYHREGGFGWYSLEVFVWPSGSRTKIHDHICWGAFCCVVGSLLEERYERLDDGCRLDYARLKKLWRLRWGPEDGASTVLPFEGDIHRVGNPGEETAISVHLYGPRVGEIDGRDYDPSRDFVCDRGIS